MMAWSAGVSAATPTRGRTIEVWIRKAESAGSAGSGGAGATPPRSRRVDLDSLPSTRATRLDAQYGDVRQYRGVSLLEILKRFAPPSDLDLAILHFANGMAIPLPFRDPVVMKRLDPFVARAIRGQGRASSWSSAFPAITKRDLPADRRPIQFSGNKVVVAEQWHPEISAAAQGAFSPWMNADSLTGIELCEARPYYAQFEVAGNEAVRRGLALFRANCQFCHGARQVGASFGWDFVESAPIFSYQESPGHLYHNVAYKPRNAGELGLMMPALAFLTETDAADLVAWLQALSPGPMPPYLPHAGAR